MEPRTGLLMVQKSSFQHCIKACLAIELYTGARCLDFQKYWISGNSIVQNRRLSTSHPGVGLITTPTIPIVLPMLVSCATCTAKNFKPRIRLILKDKHIGGVMRWYNFLGWTESDCHLFTLLVTCLNKSYKKLYTLVLLRGHASGLKLENIR